MTSWSEIRAVKERVSEARRQRLALAGDPMLVPKARCRGCGGELEGKTLGCDQCINRHSKWRGKGKVA